MAYFGFTNKLIKGETIKIFNFGNCKRDFTYVGEKEEGKEALNLSLIIHHAFSEIVGYPILV